MKNPTLSQVVAVVTGKKERAKSVLTEIYHKLQKAALFEGLERRYEPLNDAATKLPPESKLIQYKVEDAIRAASEAMTDLIDSVATQDWGNTQARADIVINGEVIASQIPVTHLLFLEKQIVDLRTFISKIPVLDPGEKWKFDAGTDSWATGEYLTFKTKKVPQTLLKAEATEHHPAQVEVYYDDVDVGIWRTIRYSGAIPAKTKNELLQRVNLLAEAIKLAREEGNNLPVERQKIAHKLLDYVFAVQE